MTLPAYGQYKNSGIEWLGDMPAHWDVRRTKFLFDLMSRPASEDDGIVTAFRDGQVTLRSNRRTDGFTNAIKEIGYQGVRCGDLVIHAMDAFAGAIGVSDSDGKSTPVYSVCRPKDGVVNPHFYAHMLRHMAVGGFINSLAKGIRERSTDFRWADAGALFLPLPKIEEQNAVVAFLDRETAKIDALIAEQEKLLALLAEKRQATISQVVTRGLDPNAPMKDSGIPWQGEVPVHWEVLRLKRVVMFQRGHDLPQDQREEGEIPVVSSGGIIGTHNVAQAKAPGIVTGRYGSIGEFTFVETDYWPLNTALYSIELFENVPRFVWYMLQGVAEHFILNSTKSAVPGVDRNDIHIVEVARPPIDEQLKIAEFLDGEARKFDALRREVQSAIELLKERRSALISAAVTGKIDARGALPSQEAA